MATLDSDAASRGTTTDQNAEALPRVGIAPDSWGVWNPQDPAQPPAEQYLREVQEAGYHWTELGPFGYLGTDPAKLQDDLAAHDLQLSAGTVFLALHTGDAGVEQGWEDVKEVADVVLALGGEHIIAIPQLWERGADGGVQGPRELDADEWNALCGGHDEIGRRLVEEYGLGLQFHSHAESPIGSYREVIRLLEGTDPRFMNLCLDTGHLAYYQADVVRIIQKHPDRTGYLHLKQVEPDLLSDVLKNDIPFAEAVQRGVMIEPPHGIPGYGPILDLATETTPGIFAVVEQDMYPLADFAEPVKIARRTREYIEGCGAPVRLH